MLNYSSLLWLLLVLENILWSNYLQSLVWNTRFFFFRWSWGLKKGRIRALEVSQRSSSAFLPRKFLILFLSFLILFLFVLLSRRDAPALPLYAHICCFLVKFDLQTNVWFCRIVPKNNRYEAAHLPHYVQYLF